MNSLPRPCPPASRNISPAKYQKLRAAGVTWGAKDIACAICMVPPGERCRTIDNTVQTDYHRRRINDAARAALATLEKVS